MNSKEELGIEDLLSQDLRGVREVVEANGIPHRDAEVSKVRLKRKRRTNGALNL